MKKKSSTKLYSRLSGKGGVVPMGDIRFKMGSPGEIRRTLTRVSNMVANGKIDSKQANAIIYAANGILSSIRADEQQNKIDELERLLKKIEARK